MKQNCKQFLGQRVKLEVKYLNARRKVYSLLDFDYVVAMTLSLKFVLHRSDLAGFGRVAEL